jgi:exopolysaccharide production protein ExoZ
MPTKRKAIENIQIMRGGAALSVALAHAAAQFPVERPIPRVAAAQAGVDIFFVISGFIMVYVTESRRQTGAEFFLNRCARIVPNYWLYTAFTAALALAAHSFFRETTFTLPHFILSMLFIAHPNPAIPGSASPLLRPGWTLNFEIFFYLIFALSLFAWKRRVWITAGTIAALVIVGLLFHIDSVAYGVYTSPIMLEFVLGMILAVLYLRGLPRVPAVVPLLIGIGGVLAIFAAPFAADASHRIRVLCFGLPAFAIMGATLLVGDMGRGAVGRLLTRLGDASYSIYLTHPFTVAGCRVLARKLHLEPHSMAAQIAFVLVAVIAAALVGVLAYQWIETRLIQWTRLLLHKRIDTAGRAPAAYGEAQ